MAYVLVAGAVILMFALASFGKGFRTGVTSSRMETMPGGFSVLQVGDSQAEGLAPFVRAIVERMGGTYHSRFHRGISTTQYAQSEAGNLSQLVHRLRPHIVIVTLGTNDAGFNTTPARMIAWQQAVRTILRAAKLGNAVYWWGPPALARRDLIALPGTLTDAGLADLVGHEGGLYIDLSFFHPLAGQEESFWRADGVHLTAEGYRMLATGAMGSTLAYAGQVLAARRAA